MDWNLALKIANEAMDHNIAVVQAPGIKEIRDRASLVEKQFAEWQTEMGRKGLTRLADESRDAYTTRFTRFLESIITPSFAKAEELSRRGPLQDRMLDLLVLAARSKANTGKWPASLAELPLTSPPDLYPIEKPGTLRYVVTPLVCRLQCRRRWP